MPILAFLIDIKNPSKFLAPNSFLSNILQHLSISVSLQLSILSFNWCQQYSSKIGFFPIPALVEEIVESSDSLLPIDEFNSGDNRKIKDQNSIIDVVKPMEEEDDLAIGLPKHDYKTLSNTPKMKEFSPRKIIEPYDYDKARKESNKGKV